MAMFEPNDGAKTTVFAGGSRTVLNFVHAAKSRRKWLAVGAGASLIVAGAAAFGYSRYAQSQAATRVVDGYSSMSRCLLGEPLADSRARRAFERLLDANR